MPSGITKPPTKLLDRIIAASPQSFQARGLKGLVAAQWKGDLSVAEKVFSSILPETEPDGVMTMARVWLLILERKLPEALEVVQQFRGEALSNTTTAPCRALIVILHMALGVTYRLRDLSECKTRLLRLRLEMQTFRMRMVLNPEFPIDEFESELLDLRKRWVDACLTRTDLFETKKLREGVQNFLDTQIT